VSLNSTVEWPNTQLCSRDTISLANPAAIAMARALRRHSAESTALAHHAGSKRR
jgi:hypothetical protein